MHEWFHSHMNSTASHSAMSQKTQMEAEQILRCTPDLSQLSLFCRLWPFPKRETVREALSQRTDDFLDQTLASLCNKEFGPQPCLNLSTHQKAEKIVCLLRPKQDPAWHRTRTPLDPSRLPDADAITAEMDHRSRQILRTVPFGELVRYALGHDAQLRTLSDIMTILDRELCYCFHKLREPTKKCKMVTEVSRSSSARQ